MYSTKFDIDMTIPASIGVFLDWRDSRWKGNTEQRQKRHWRTECAVSV